LAIFWAVRNSARAGLVDLRERRTPRVWASGAQSLKADTFTHRLAAPDDMPAQKNLMTAAARELLPQIPNPGKG